MATVMGRPAAPPLRRANPTAPNPLSRRPYRNRLDRLHSKTALVTGAAKRIGRSLALALADAGADVAITYRGSKVEAADTVEALQRLGVRGMAVECDVRSPESVGAAVAAVVEQFGRLDVLVNNAGVFETAAVQAISLA